MKRRIGLVVALAMMLGGLVHQPTQAAGAVGATRQAVLSYIAGLAGKANNRIISGQFGFYGEGQTPEAANATLGEVAAASGGKQVAMTGADYNAHFVTQQGNLSETNQWLIAKWREGYLVNVSWHAPNPFDPALTGAAVQVGAWDFKANTIKKLLKPGDAAYERWQESLKFAADGLTELRDAGVVVIWRPFHEMNGAWFWWGWQAKADFVALWRDMHQYFTQERGLNNLIWAYSPNAAWDKWATPPNFYYPGGDVVDLVGMDFYGPRMMDAAELNIAYTNPDTGKSHIGSYDQLVALGKPMGLFEFGPSPADTSGWDDPKYDFAKLARDIRAKYPKIVMFQAWEWIWRIGAHENASGLMNDPWVISLDEVPAFGR